MCGAEDEAKKHYRRHSGSKTSDVQQDVVLSEPQRHSDNKNLTNIQHADHESAAGASDERRPAAEEKTVERARTSTTGKTSVSDLGQPAPE